MRFIVFLVLVYVFMRLINRFFFARPQAARRMQSPFGRGGAPASVREMVQDPVCKVYIPKKDALTLARDGTTYYFCCTECMKKFNGGADS